ncbi:MAG: LPS-assembly protein LptD, partial [Crocinitomicaceae bacterium]|nr:LPS-assembly protein LptD [Crocinitomicaceae bacterium]
MCGTQVSYAQDTLVLNSDDIKDPIFYSADDSIYADLKANTIHLYGNAMVDNGGIHMDAGYIMIDRDKEEIAAEYIYDADSNMIQLPHFTDGSEEIVAQKVRYNFKTEKAFIEEVAITQDEIFLYMGVAKKQANDEIHFRKGRFTTCDLEEPHYHFQLSKAVMVPEKRIVSGPMNLWIKGIPTPIGLPFAIIPQVEDKTQGLIFPEITPLSAYGFGFQNLGYYIPINDKIQTTIYGTLYSRGSWGLRNSTQYANRYKYSGSFDVGYQQFRAGFPTNVNRNKATVKWTHRKDPKSNPYWTFNSNINFVSDNNTQNSLDPLNEDYFNNTLKSDINLSRRFPNKPISMGAKLSLSQNSQTKNISLTSPILNVNVTSFYPLKKLIKKPNKKGFLKPFKELGSRMAVTYNFKGENRALFQDSLLSKDQYRDIGSKFMNGFDQSARIQTTAGFFKNTWKLTPSITYGNKINFQQSEKFYEADSTIRTDTIQQVGMAHTLNLNASLTTVLYSYYRFAGKNKPLLRHVLTPSFSYSYRPNLNPLLLLYDTLYSPDSVIYSPFEGSLYSIGSVRAQSTLSFGFNNTFELKRKSDKDTLTGFKKTRIIDALSFRGSYDFKDSLTPLSSITTNMRISPTKWMNFVTTASF